jgi:hypothetical protein
MAVRIRLVAAGAIGFALLAAGVMATSTAAAPTAQRGGSTSFPDATGENAAGPDITTMTVANDDAGNLTFTVSLANRPTLGSSEVILAINSDNNFATGNDKWDGAEFAIDLTTKDGGGVAKWTGSQWDWGTPQTTFLFSYAAGTASFKINAAELGNTKTFTFVGGAGEAEQYDWAPENGDFSYTLQASAPVTKTVAKAPSKPAKKKKKHH